MTHNIKIQVIKVVSLVAMLMVTGQAVYSAPVKGKDVPKLNELIEKRKTDPNIPINMPNADLYNANLDSANLKLANLQGSDLGDSLLLRANLTQANLTYAKFNARTIFTSRLGFHGATVTGANFANAKDLARKTKYYLRQNGAINVPN